MTDHYRFNCTMCNSEQVVEVFVPVLDVYVRCQRCHNWMILNDSTKGEENHENEIE